MPTLQLPDIDKGYIVNGWSELNRFTTAVISVLIKHSENSKNQIAYLCKECRSESISNYDSPGIFTSRQHSGLSAMIHSWKGRGMIRIGASFHSPWNKQKSKQLHCNVTQGGLFGKIFVNNRYIERLTSTDVLNIMRNCEENNIYMRVKFTNDIGDKYSLIAACKYINFSNITHEQYEFDYMQPISGNVIIEENGEFKLAYIAVHILGEQIKKVQLAVNTPINIFETKEKLSGRFYNLFKLLVFPLRLFNAMLSVDEYNHIITLQNAEVLFFRYK